MKSTHLILGAFLLAWAACSGDPPSPKTAPTPDPATSSTHEFSEWMSKAELNRYNGELVNKNGDRYWITAIEGRWHLGWAEFRIAHELKPEGFHCAYHWEHDVPLDKISSRITVYGDQDFQLVSFQKFPRPDGVERYQAVWHKVIPIRAPKNQY